MCISSKNPVIIRAQDVQHDISAWIDPAGELRIEHNQRPTSTTGTQVSLTLPSLEDQKFDPDYWAKGYALFNPHATVKICNSKNGDSEINHAESTSTKNEKIYHPTEKFPGGWRKFLPTDLTSIWWYSKEDLEKLVFSYIGESRRNGKDLTLREFVRQFRGLSGTGKAKQVCDKFSNIGQLNDFEIELNQKRILSLWHAMRELTRAPAPTVLGIIGEEHFRKCFDEWFRIKPDRFWYVKTIGPSAKERGQGKAPFVFEVAIAETEKENPGFFSGLNFSPTYEDFLSGNYLSTSKITGYGIRGFLDKAHASGPNMTTAVHLACPVLEFLDRGKSHLKVKEEDEG